MEETTMPRTHAMFFKMLSARSRIQILKLLREHDDLTVEDLANNLSITAPTVSRHLQLLRMQNLVTFEQDAQNRYYSVNEKEITQRITAFLRDLGIALPNA
jgi:ArsR family transcriptional regulator